MPIRTVRRITKSSSLPKQIYHANDPSHGYVFDFNCHRLVFPSFANAASQAQHWPGSPISNIVGPSPALAGAQLIAEIPKLRFQNATGDPCKTPQVREIYLATRESG